MSVKYQITLPDDLAAELKRTAARVKVPLAEFIRDAMEEKLGQSRRRRSSDPFAAITAIIESEETDLASRVDEILYR